MSDKLSANIAANLKRLREARQISQQRLSDLSGVPRPTLAHLESGGANPTLSLMLRVSEALGVRLEELWQPPESAIAHWSSRNLPTRKRAGALLQQLPLDPSAGLAFERAELKSAAQWVVKPQAPGNRHYLFCESGEVEISAAGERCALVAGEVAAVASDLGFSARNGKRPVAVLFHVIAPVLHHG